MTKRLILVAVVAVAMLGASHAHAAGPLRAVGLHAGYISPENIDGTWNAGLYFEVGAPLLGVYLQPFVTYWNQSVGGATNSMSASADMKDWSVGANLKWLFPVPTPKVHPFVAAGGAVHRFSSDASMSFGPNMLSPSASDSKFGVQFGGGVELDMGRSWSLVGQSFYHVVSDVNQWTVGGALQIHL